MGCEMLKNHQVVILSQSKCDNLIENKKTTVRTSTSSA